MSQAKKKGARTTSPALIRPASPMIGIGLGIGFVTALVWHWFGIDWALGHGIGRRRWFSHGGRGGVV